MRSLKRNSIRTRLLVSFVSIALLPALALSVVTMLVGYYNGRQQAINQLESVAALKSQQIQTWIQGLQNELGVVLNEEFAFERASIVLDLASENKYYSFYSGAMRSRLQRVVAQSQQLREIYLIDLQNRVVLSTDPANEGKLDLEETFRISQLRGPHLEMAIHAGQTSASIVILLPVTGIDGNLVGAIAGRTSLLSITRILRERTGLGKTGKSYLVAPNNETLTVERLDNLETGTKQRSPGPAANRLITETAQQQDNRSGFYDDYRGVRVAGVYRWHPELGMEILVEQDQAEVFQAIFTTLLVNGGVAMTVVLIAALVALLITSSISRPLVNLVRTASQIAAGDTGQTARVERDDELGVLATAFNVMTAQLRDSINSLERRVQERTFELQAAFAALERRALQLEASAQVSRVATSILNLDDLLTRVADLIWDVFGYYHVLIFLVDPETNRLVVRAMSGGRQPTIQSLAIGPGSLNGEAVKYNAVLLVNDVSADPRYLPDPNLPDTCSELVIPLRVGEQVIGTLDVHSKQLNAFTSEDGLVIQSLGDQIAIAIENARLYEQSQRLAILEERNRLARELHDSVTQSLYSLRLLAEGWRRQAGTQNDRQVEDYLRQIGEVTDHSLREMRLLIYELRPQVLQQEGLIGAIHQRLESVEKRAGLEARLLADNLVELPTEVEEALYWIAQEALNNALKHASASEITLRLISSQERVGLQEHVLLEVEDNGRGYHLGESGQAGGMGILSMKERARKLNGRLEINTRPAGGTLVRAIIPLRAGVNPADPSADESLMEVRQ